MKNRNYTKLNPKARKKRHASLLKQIKMKQQSANEQKTKTSGKQKAPTPLKKVAPFKQRPKKLNKVSSAWKLPTIMMFSSLLVIILIIPTLIVVPFGKDKQTETSQVEKKPEPIIESKESPFSVAVMRATSETVEDVPLESYVAGVVASEMNAGFEMEALKAQALAARTYTVNQVLHNKSEAFDLTDTTQHQVYKNENELKKIWGSEFKQNMNKIKKAVAETQGEILTYKDAPISPAYFSTSNGYTENSEDYWEEKVPYLRSVKSPWDKSSPKFLDQETFTIEEIEKKLAIELPKEAPLSIEVTRTDGKRVDKLEIEGETFSGRIVREKLELQSSDFVIKQKSNHLIFTTKGWGHGIGMSQYGANGMAKEGKTYKEIVKHYYKDTKVSTITDTAPTLVAK